MRRLDRRARRRPRRRSAPTAGSSSSRSTAPRSTACGTRAAIRRTATTATPTASPPRAHAAVGQRRRALRPRARRRAGARATPRDFVAPAPDGPSSPSTPSSSGTTGTRASTFLQRVLELADVDARSTSAGDAAPAPSTRRPRAGAPARDLRTWSRGAELAWTPAQRRAARRSARDRPTRALRELLALQSSDWAFLIYSGTRRRLSRASAPKRTTGVRFGACWTKRSDELRNLAPRAGGLGLRAALTLKSCTDPAEHMVEAACTCAAVNKSRVPVRSVRRGAGEPMEPWSGSRGESPSETTA